MLGLPLSFCLAQQPGIGRWLERLDQLGYVTGAELAEGPCLTGNFDGSMVERVLEQLEAAGTIRRGEERPSVSQLAFNSLGGCATMRGKDIPAPPSWHAWHPHKGWRHPAFRAEAPPAERCDFCDTGRCWTHRKEEARL